jgi:alpha-galactosidase
MASGVKITIIGAGSAVFSLALVKDLCLTESLWGSKVSFMDIDPERLEVVLALAWRFAQEIGADLRFESTLDRKASLEDADFVVNTAYPKGHHHERRMRELTAKHGYYYGGIHVGDYYNFQLMMDVARDIEQICPDAWLLQSANPVFDGCTLLNRETDLKIVGLCHGHYGYQEIACTLGLDPSRITWQAPGLNHCIWLTHFSYDGENAYPKIDEWIATQAEKYWSSHVATRPHDVQMSRGAVHQYHMYGLFPVGDTVRHQSWWYHTDLGTKRWWFGSTYGGPDTEIARPVYVANLESRFAEMARYARDPEVRVTEVYGTAKSREQHVPIVDALVNNQGGEFQVNVPNQGLIEGLPDDVVVEVPAIIDKRGLYPLKVGTLSKKIMLEQILPRWLEMERNVEACKTGDWTMLLWNALDCHQTRRYQQAVVALEDLRAMEGHEDLARHFPIPPFMMPWHHGTED